MILSCPSCATRYSVEESSLGDGGRRGRCAACGHTWRVDAPDGAPAVKTEAPPEEPKVLTAAPKEPARAYRDKVEARRRRRGMMIGAGAWGTVAAALLVMLGAAWVFRLDIVRAWPQTASAYALVGSKANPYGLAIEDVTARRVFVEGDPVLEVEGVLRNIDRRPRGAPYVRFALQDAQGEEFFAWTVEPDAEALEAGERVAVVTQLVNPPDRAANVALTFADAPIAIEAPNVTVESPPDGGAEAGTETDLAQGGEAG